MSWVYDLDGINEPRKGRLKMANAAWRDHVKKDLAK